MKYMGSKSRLAKEVLQITIKNRESDQWYVEPFCGGCNIIDKVTGNRIANDIHPNLIALWKALMAGWKPEKVTKEFYQDVRLNRDNYEPHVVGWVGFCCSYCGVYFVGFSGETKTKLGTVRDYQAEAIRNVMRQVELLKGVVFENRPYMELVIPPGSIVYCDPPYEGVSQYEHEFDHNVFWEWVRETSNRGHTVYVSEYNAPADFECVWSKTVKSSLSANGLGGGSKESVERLFRL